jgi:hypothetical protein
MKSLRRSVWFDGMLFGHAKSAFEEGLFYEFQTIGPQFCRIERRKFRSSRNGWRPDAGTEWFPEGCGLAV